MILEFFASEMQVVLNPCSGISDIAVFGSFVAGFFVIPTANKCIGFNLVHFAEYIFTIETNSGRYFN
ncbi:MAG: hypothetical protein CVU11_14670 [Bacteroidetes bacterium HGW-Bacteroidetes-6]|nr:MAG: hypothetical protein CVU11_14670 [Bacteroidetes bacterium HGW-Bacteroidetes-6]